jgi:predicted Zn finger-like uncharacterized protein
MILACPNCRIRYQVEDAAVPAGRLVRCASCGHRWPYMPEATAPAEPPPPAPVAPALTAPREPAAVPPPPPLSPARRSGWAAFAWVFLIVLAAAAALVGVVARDAIIAQWPAADRLYAAVGLPVELPGTALKITNIAPLRTAEGLVIEGDVTNAGKLAHEVPQLRLSLRDAAQKEVQFKIIIPPKEKLLPGEVAHFKAPFEKPSGAATDVEVTFASG